MGIMSLREALRQSTRADHERVDRLLKLDSPELTLARYGEFVRCAHAFHAAMEPAFEGGPLEAWGIDMERRSKRAWLEDDLRHLALAPLPPPETPPPRTKPALLGRAYVLEGATLGGRVLLERLSPRCGISPGGGATYLAGYAAETGRMWRSFVSALDAAPLTAAEAAACIAGARETFAAYEALFRARGWG